MKTIQIFSLLKKGSLHPAYCEDFQIAIDIADEYSVFAVMDGCSAGVDSHFASALMGKLICKAARLVYHSQVWNQLGVGDLPEPQDARGLARFLLAFAFEDMRRVRNELMLDPEEMLSTIILLAYDRVRDQAFITVKGDGFVAIDGKVREIDELNTPRYPGLFLDRPWSEWLAMQEEEFTVDAPQEISIATDGVDSYLRPDLSPDEDIDSVAALLTGPGDNSPTMLEAKHRELLARGVRPVDDVSIVRLRFTESPAPAQKASPIKR